MTINKSKAQKIAKKLGITVDAVTPIYERSKDETNTERLSKALSSLPVPAAFSSAKIALRNLRKENPEQNEESLKLLYRLAVIESFCVEPYSEIAQCPTFNIMQLGYKTLIEKEYDWNTYGYEKLNLNKSDIKALVELFGDPAHHTTLNETENSLYKTLEIKAKRANIL